MFEDLLTKCLSKRQDLVKKMISETELKEIKKKKQEEQSKKEVREREEKEQARIQFIRQISGGLKAEIKEITKKKQQEQSKKEVREKDENELARLQFSRQISEKPKYGLQLDKKLVSGDENNKLSELIDGDGLSSLPDKQRQNEVIDLGEIDTEDEAEEEEMNEEDLKFLELQKNVESKIDYGLRVQLHKKLVSGDEEKKLADFIYGQAKKAEDFRQHGFDPENIRLPVFFDGDGLPVPQNPSSSQSEKLISDGVKRLQMLYSDKSRHLKKRKQITVEANSVLKRKNSGSPVDLTLSFSSSFSGLPVSSSSLYRSKSVNINSLPGRKKKRRPGSFVFQRTHVKKKLDAWREKNSLAI